MIDIPKGTYVPVFSLISHPTTVKAGRRYRLSVTLVRVADEAEIWATEQEAQIIQSDEEQRLALQF